MFDWTINFGHILTILGFAGATFICFVTVRTQVSNLGNRMASIESEMKKLVEILIQQGVHSERMNSMDGRITLYAQDVSDLAHKVDRLFEPSVQVIPKHK